MRDNSAGVLSGNIGVVIGAVLGVVSSFFALASKYMKDEWVRKREETRWLSNELVGRLEAARLNIRSQQSVDIVLGLRSFTQATFPLCVGGTSPNPRTAFR